MASIAPAAAVEERLIRFLVAETERRLGIIDTTVHEEPVLCVHHWMIDPVKGEPTGLGSCAKCGETREFKVSFDEGARRRRGPKLQQKRKKTPWRNG